jgi:RHS repeat-associated protein
MLEERFVSGGTLLASNQYVWSPRYVDSPIVRFHDGNGDGDYLDAGDNIRYYTTDANHNVTATIDATTGNVVERYVYNAYGKATVYSPTWTNPAAPTTDGPLYCGYFFDAESNLYQVRNRYYDSGLSTFISRDPIGYAAGDFNLYRYCGNDPTRAVDPLGLDDIVIAGPGSKLSIDEWFQKFIWEPLQRNGGTSLPRGRLLDVLRAGCIGLATLMNQLNAPVLDPRTGEFLGNMPDLRMGFATLPEAIKYRDEQDKDHPIKWTGTTISGNAPQYRVFAVLYSSKNESYPTAEPQRRGDGSYDLSTQDVMLTIAERSRPRATRFDFFTLSVLGDPWYDAQHPWVHATEGGKDMTLKATDNKGIEREKNNNNSDFDRLFYFVACERQF